MLSALIAGIGGVLTAFISAFSYGGIFVLMFLESANIPIPSEVIMPFGGFLAANNKMIFWLVVAAGTLGNIGGSAFSYWLGLRGEERWGKSFGITARDVARVHHWFDRFGPITILVAKFIPAVRTFVSFPAGMYKMDFKKFLLYTGIGSLGWSWILTYLGVLLGGKWQDIGKVMDRFNIVLLIAVIAIIVWWLWRHIARHRTRIS